ncbi:MAG: aminodeoxychorismate lyase, partial [Azoarcus sp.]|nr:aminodeoxychorismate lyase [Azoarcus sp.]
MMRWLTRTLLIGLFALFAALAAVGWFYRQISSPLHFAGERIEFQVAPGSGMRAAARDIAAAGIDFNPWMLVALGKLTQAEGSIKAGSYEIGQGTSLRGL